MHFCIVLLLWCLVFLNTKCDGARILGIFPAPVRSHLILGNALMTTLARKGHDVSIITAFPIDKPVPRFREIKIRDIKPKPAEDENSVDQFINRFGSNPFTIMSSVYDFGYKMSSSAMEDPEVQKLLNSTEKFDIVISEIFMNEIFLQFAERFNAHAIGFSTIGPTEWTNDLVGNPKEYAYSPEIFLGFTDRMTFTERLINTGVTLLNEYFYNYVHLPKQEQLRKKYFPGTKPLYERLQNVSLVLLNSHVSITTPKPLVPNMIEIGGFHVGEPGQLPQDLKKLLDDSKDGVVYFSMGSNIQSKDLPVAKREAFLNVFGKLKQTVLWKWETENLPGQPKNVITSKWFPQQDILAHPNVKLFITHGGLLSTTEAITRGVPMLGIPIFADQKMNMRNAQSLGYGVTVEFTNVTEQSLSWALMELLENPKYSKVVKYRSSVLNDRIVKPVDEAVYWIEYVVRHKGATHLRTARQSLNFFQYNLLDLMAFVGGILIIIVLIVMVTLKKIYGLISGSNKMTKPKKKTN